MRKINFTFQDGFLCNVRAKDQRRSLTITWRILSEV